MNFNELVGYIFAYGVPIVILIFSLIMLVVAMGAAIAWTRYIVYVIIIIMLLIPSASNYGTVDGQNAASSIFWTKGSKNFFFTFLEMAIFGSWFLGVVVASRLSNKRDKYYNPLANWYVAYGVLFLGYVVLALFRKGPVILEFANMGVINILKQGMLVSLLFAVLRTEQEVKTFIKIILSCLAMRETWGLFRYVFLGGDPQNIYANVYSELRGLKLTFFDINDHVLACLMFGLAVWTVLVDRISARYKFLYLLVAVIAVLIPVLSARRTAQGGLLLSMIILILLLPKGRKGPVVIAFALILPLSVAALSLRTVDQSKSISEKILIDVKADPKASRFYELFTAWDTIKEEPFFGVGPSGQFKVKSSLGLEYHEGNYGFVHSGFGHVLLKTGFVGLFIFLGLLITYIVTVVRGWKTILAQHKALVIGCLCGFTAQIPNFFFGPPIIEIRSMLVGGLTFALPLICIAIGAARAKVGSDNESDNSNQFSYFSPTIPLGKLGKTL